MLHLIVITFMQVGLSVLPVKADIVGMYTRDECLALAAKESKVVEMQPGDDARWQVPICVPLLSVTEPTATPLKVY